MLTQLKIHNFALVEHLEIDFTEGLNVITGETGAGKSIMIDALSLALGERADSGCVRQGAQQADIVAFFDCRDNPAAQQWLAQHELAQEDECIVRRTVNADGRSRAYINGLPSTALSLKQLGYLLVNIHGQHEHQNLLQRETQCQLLDHFAGHQSILHDIKNCFEDWQSKQQALRQNEANRQQQTERLELLTYQLKELDELHLQAGELEDLEDEHRKLASIDQLRQHCQQALQVLSNHDKANALQLVHAATRELSQVRMADTALETLQSFLASVSVQLEELSHDLEGYLGSLENQPERLQFLDERIKRSYQLARKFRIPAPELPAYQTQLQQELEQLGHGDQQHQVLLEQERELHAIYQKKAEMLSQSRRQQALPLAAAINQCLTELGMASANLHININSNRSQASALGYDQVEFEIATNVGQPVKALNKIVSGGELSRISLAIQVICAEKYATPTLIFDEVDVGIGGSTAHVVGRLLRKLSQTAQVLCVTHQAQVAAQGHQHFSVLKTSQNNHTITEVLTLNHNNKIKEIARMLGGGELSPESLQHAKAMLLAVD
ncbi:MAG TPA: DNA repair protein RecN [Pseudomonadales bacterium]|nr:DNA repair protein RecN [Pseudomonadales bacterium]